MQELTYSELRYRRLFEAARDGILIVDPSTRLILDVNPFLVEFLEYSREEIIGKELHEFGFLKDAKASKAAFKVLQRTGYIRYDDLPLKTKTGRSIDVEFVSNLYQEGDHQVIQCNVRDISARKATDLALRQSEERFKLVSRAVSDVVWDWNLVTDQLWLSDGFLNTFGYSADEVESGLDAWSNRIHPEERGRVLESIHRAIDSGSESWREDYRFRCKNDSYAFVQDNGYIIRDPQKNGIRMVGGMKNLTEQKMLEAQYLRAQRLESIGTLAGGIAHDLNNVLTPIMMSIELLKLSTGNNPETNRVLDTIHVNCRRGADLVRQVLSFARGVDGQRVEISLKALCVEFLAIAGQTLPRNIRIQTEIPDDLWTIAGDPTQLNQVLLNLAVNARDAMPTGGEFTLRASNFRVDESFASSSAKAKPGRYVLIEASDTGVGIPPGIRERIFEPFFTTKDIGKGTGLGLATVETIVKSHGGFLSIESEEGFGTVFKIYLPATTFNVHSTPPLVDKSPLRGNGELILLVDDEASIRSITRKTLEAYGYCVLEAKDGAEAVAVYAKRSDDVALVLTDLMMPVMDGTATVRVLRRINPSVKIIAVSGLNPAERGPVDAGDETTCFLQKPYTARELVSTIKSALASLPVTHAPA